MEAKTTIEDLYSEKARIQVKFKEHEAPFEIGMVYEPSKYGNIANGTPVEPDCKIGSWTANTWFRTGAGIEGKKYSTIGALKAAITKTAKSRGLTTDKFIFETV